MELTCNKTELEVTGLQTIICTASHVCIYWLLSIAIPFAQQQQCLVFASRVAVVLRASDEALSFYLQCSSLLSRQQVEYYPIVSRGGILVIMSDAISLN